MSTSSLTQAIESASAQLATRAGNQYGANASPVESIVACYGDFFTTLAYAGFFFPEIRIVDGVPFARFPTKKEDTPFDCVHVNLLHHNQAAGRTPEVINILGEVLAIVWSHNLQHSRLPGRFVYDGSSDVVYIP